MWREGIHTSTRTDGLILATANSSGIAQGFLGPVPEGYCWYVERYTSFVNASRSTAECEIFVQTAPTIPSSYTATVGDRGGRQDVITGTGACNAISDNKSPVYVGEGYFLVAFWTGLTQNDRANLSTQCAVHIKSLSITPHQLVVQETEPTADVNEDEATADLAEENVAMHETADIYREFGKAL